MLDKAYKDWLVEIKQKIRSAQLKAAVAVNTELILLYWELGKNIAERENIWGSKLIAQMRNDLKEEFPDMQGLSVSNLKYCKRFYQFYQMPIGQQPVDQLEQAAKETGNTEVYQGQKESNHLIGQQLVAQL